MFKRHCSLNFIYLALCCLAGLSLVCASAYAEHGSADYVVSQRLGDGKHGRVWSQWSQGIEQRAVRTVEAVVRRVGGGNDAFVNLRFGNGQAFENGRQVFLSDDASHRVEWNVRGQHPGGQNLVMNAYNGEVLLEKVTVNFVPAPQATQLPKPTPKVPPGKEGSGGTPGTWPGSDHAADERDYDEECNQRRIGSPDLEIFSVRPSGGLFSGKYRISGELYARCVAEFGYFEEGGKKQDFDFPVGVSRFERKDFSVQARSGRNGQLRVYLTNGRRYSYPVDDYVADE